jgi:hypothetical protein
MKARTITTLFLTVALTVVGYAAAGEGAGRRMDGGMMGRGMMGGSAAGMMDGCRDMMQGGGVASGQPNAQWRDRAQKVPPAKTGHPQDAVAVDDATRGEAAR